MIRIVATGKIKPDTLSEVLEIAIPLVAGSRKEAGNISYTLNQSTTCPEGICFIEEWQDQAAIDLHNAAPHFTKAVEQLLPLLDGGLDIQLYKPLV